MVEQHIISIPGRRRARNIRVHLGGLRLFPFGQALGSFKNVILFFN